MVTIRTPRRGSAQALVGILLVALVLMGALAYEAASTARSHRATAEAALQDHAAFAVWEFARNADEQLSRHFLQSLRHIRRPSAAPLAACPLLPVITAGEFREEPVCSYFEVDLEGKTVQTRGAPVPVELVEWIRATIPHHARTTYNPQWGFATLFTRIGSAPNGVVYSIGREAAGETNVVHGFAIDVPRLAAILGSIVDHFALIPPSLTTDGSTREYLVAEASLPSGATIYRSGPPLGSYRASYDLGPRFGGLTLNVALRPLAAEQLLIGGLPRSRLPFLLGLLLLTCVLVGIAFVQLRKETELARLHADFVSGVSHELRTPLAQIRLFAETLLLGRTRSEDERRRSLEIIDNEAKRLTQLVENVLLFSRNGHGQARITREPSELARLIQSATDAFAPLARPRGTRFRVDLERGVHASVDAGALRQMLLNLLENAVKYGPPNQEVLVGMALFGERARIWVDDAGPGIPRRQRQRVFEPFHRLERHSGSVGGSGIGLAVVRELVRLHDGRVWIEDAPGGGARFVLEIPGAELRPLPDERASTGAPAVA
ncbi:MAG: HAMP domain-containing histidine kinase [Gemmatimonadetes bacterium]|nr:HAMP domain-containing histidine kinase [Gemmatimonadota bacterium]